MNALHRRVCIMAALLCVLFGVTGVGWWLIREEEQPSEVLSDGTVVKLYGATCGKTHRMATGSIWQRMAGRILPRQLARRWTVPVIDHVTTNDALVVWLEIDARAVRSPIAFPATVYSGPTVAIGDEHGSEFPSSTRTASRPTPNGFVQGYEMPIVPPGNDALSVIVRPASFGLTTQTDVRLRLRRPAAAGQSPSAQRRPFTTSRVDNLEVVLRTFETSRATAPSGYPRTRADCLIFEDGQPTTNWAVRWVDILDEAGRFHRMVAGRDSSGGVGLSVGLSTNQVWRVRFFLGRTAGFTSNDLATVRDIPLTVSQRAAFRPVTNVIHGANFVLYDVSGFGNCGLSTLVAPATEPVDVVFVSAMDDRRRKLVRGGSPPGQVLRDNSCVFNFTVKTELESETADLTFAVTRMKAVEVFVKPTAATNSPSIFRPPAK